MAVGPRGVAFAVGAGVAAGALALLPGFQVGLLAALAVALWSKAPPGRWATGLALLLAAQAAALAVIGPALPGAAGSLVVGLRAWALALPILAAATIVAVPATSLRAR